MTLPAYERGQVVLPAPAPGPGNWVGAPSAVYAEGAWWLAYRLRRPVGQGRGYGNVVARSSDGVSFEPVCTVSSDFFGGDSLERPALVRTPGGRWRLYVSVATPGSKHWRVDLLEAASPRELASSAARAVLPGSAAEGVKDAVVLWRGGLWHLWATVHPLEVPDAEDRMTTRYATSPDGVAWSWRWTALSPGAGWDARGARLTAVLVDGDLTTAYYDGRASAEENWEERTGLARGVLADGLFGPFTPSEGPVGSPHGGGALRYVSAAPDPAGGVRIYYEAAVADGAHELRTERLF